VKKQICPICGGTGAVVGEDGIGFRPPKSDHEEADECADCGGTGYVLICSRENQDMD
jgi:rRNA maturation endonuclease Nob1